MLDPTQAGARSTTGAEHGPVETLFANAGLRREQAVDAHGLRRLHRRAHRQPSRDLQHDVPGRAVNDQGGYGRTSLLWPHRQRRRPWLDRHGHSLESAGTTKGSHVHEKNRPYGAARRPRRSPTPTLTPREEGRAPSPKRSCRSAAAWPWGRGKRIVGRLPGQASPRHRGGDEDVTRFPPRRVAHVEGAHDVLTSLRLDLARLIATQSPSVPRRGTGRRRRRPTRHVGGSGETPNQNKALTRSRFSGRRWRGPIARPDGPVRRFDSYRPRTTLPVGQGRIHWPVTRSREAARRECDRSRTGGDAPVFPRGMSLDAPRRAGPSTVATTLRSPDSPLHSDQPRGSY